MKVDLYQLEFIELELRKIGVYIERITGLEPTITSFYRIGDKGVHGTLPLRAIDYRMRSYIVGKCIEKLVNDRWQYDPERPEKQCAIIHGKGLEMHLHTQVHPNTVKRIDNG